jgi:uncharacterized membrane protein YqjE
MNHINGVGQAEGQERSTADLVKQMAGQVSTLVRDELKLAQVEVTSKGKQAGFGVGLLGGGGLIALYGVGCLIACMIIALSGAVAAWLAALIVGMALLAVAGIAALVGKGRLHRVAPAVPKAAFDSIKSDVEEIKERARQ